MKKLILTSLSIALSTFIYAQPPSYIPTNGLVSWYPFNGNANDESGNGNHGIIIGGTTLTSDRLGNSNMAYSFDGNADYIDCGNSPSVNITGALTISAWCYSNDFTSEHGIVSKAPVGSAYDLQTNDSNIRFINEFTLDPPITLNTWYHIVSIFDSSAQKIYTFINGACIDTILTSFNSLALSSDNLTLGAHRPLFTPNWSWNGKLDEIGIWNRTLSQTEITQIFNETIASNCNPFAGSLLTGLVASYPFCGNANDESGNNNHCFAANGALLTQDRFGANNNAYFLDGIDDWIETNTNFYDPSTPHTLSIWWQTTDSIKSYQVLFNTNPHPTEVLAFNIPGASYYLNFGLGDGVPGSWSIVHPDTGLITVASGLTTWHNTVWVRSGNNWTFYQDGTSVLTYTSALNTIPTNCTLRFGAENNLPSGGAQFKGNIDDIGIWNRALSPSEVLNVFTGGTTAQYQQNPDHITVYPNPTNDFITIELQDHPLSNFEITDQIGRSIEKGILKDKVTLDIRNYRAGCYFLKVSGLKNFKILKIE